MDVRTAVKVCLFTDLVGSTDLKRRLGDAVAIALMARHDEAFRECLARFNGVEEGDTGDGFFASFDRPSDAVACALAFQQAMSALDPEHCIQVRVGLHMGEMSLLPPSGSRGGSKLLGLTVDTAARVMSLAAPGQILLTRHAFDSGRQYVRESPDGAAIEWAAHGAYAFKGVDEPLEVFEVGIVGLSPLRPPPESDKARRAVLSGVEELLGWRPAVGLTVPGRKGWVLERKIEALGFGETWLARQSATHESRAFKFCFEAEHLRALKREMALLRLMKRHLGERPDIVRLYDVRLDEAPFYLEMEFAATGSLFDWAASAGSLSQTPLQVRLELVAQIAEALAAAHSVGVIHKDIRPANVLVEQHGSGGPRARLTGFGIGQLTQVAGIPHAGITAVSLAAEAHVASGMTMSDTARPYLAPELRTGRAPTIQSDIYALGVLLYQMVVGDLGRSLQPGWQNDVADDRLREDIAACVAELTAARLTTADDLARRLRALPQRPVNRPSALDVTEAASDAPLSGRSASAMVTFKDDSIAALRDAFPGYQIIRELHRGGQGVVYQAHQKATNRKVAIKVLREGPFAGAADKARFDREVRVLAQLNHPNIVAIHDSGEAAAGCFFVMDYIAGSALDEHVEALSRRSGSVRGSEVSRRRSLRGRTAGRGTIEDTLRLFVKICSAVNAAHLRGIVHRDLKPSNVRVDADGEPRILDFGLAKTGMDLAAEAQPAAVTVTGQFVGSLPWASPEQAEGRPDLIAPTTDVYALGVMMYQLLTGQFPYVVAGNMRDVLTNILMAEPIRPSAVRRQIDDEVSTILLKCLAKERQRRYQNAGELCRDLEHYLAGEPIEAKRDSALYVVRKKLRRHRTAAAVTLVIVLVAVGGVMAVQAVRRAGERQLAELQRYYEQRSAAEEQQAATGGAAAPEAVERPPADAALIAHDATVRINVAGKPTALSPFRAASEADLFACDLLFETLFRRTPNLELFPNEHLVAAMEEPDDPRVRIVRLRPNLRWHDGSALTAEDVVFSWQRAIDPRVRSSRRQDAGRIEEVVAVDPHTVRFVLHEPHPTWRISMNFELAPLRLFIEHEADDPTLHESDYFQALHRRPVGCGPFQFVSWSDDELVLKRWPLYGERLPNVDRVVVRWTADANRRLEQFVAGEVDLCRLSEDQFNTAGFTPEFREVGESARHPDTQYYYLFWNCRPDHPFLGDPRVRRAMTHALDLERIKAQVTHNLAAACYGPWAADSPWFNPHVRRLKFDLHRAAQLLDQAGWRAGKDGLRRRLSGGAQSPSAVATAPDSTSPADDEGLSNHSSEPATDDETMTFGLMIDGESVKSRAIAEIFKADLARISVTLEIEPVDWSREFIPRRGGGDFDALIGAVTPAVDPDLNRVYFVTDGANNFGGYSNPEVDRLFELGATELDPAARARCYQEIHRLIYDDQPMTFLFHPPSLWAISKRLRGVEFSIRGPFLFHPGIQDWWVPRGMEGE